MKARRSINGSRRPPEAAAMPTTRGRNTLDPFACAANDRARRPGRATRAPGRCSAKFDAVLEQPWALPDSMSSSSRLLDHLVRPEQHRLRDGQSERFRGLRIDHQLELRRLLDGKVRWLGALQDL